MSFDITVPPNTVLELSATTQGPVAAAREIVQLRTLRDLQKHDPATGTSPDDYTKGYTGHDGVTCTDFMSIPLSDPGASCQDLGERALAGADCTLFTEYTTPGGKKSGHAMHVRAATDAADHCEVVVEDTSAQGNFQGEDIVVGPGRQTWSYPHAGTGPTVAGPAADYFNGMTYTGAWYICCAKAATSSP